MVLVSKRTINEVSRMVGAATISSVGTRKLRTAALSVLKAALD